MDVFDIFITYVSWGVSGKNRPVLFFAQEGTVANVFGITTQYANKSSAIRAQYFKITDWRQAGLAKQSYVDTNSVLDLSLSALDGKLPIGKLTNSDIQKFIEFLNSGEICRQAQP